jgi:hypothetical protein
MNPKEERTYVPIISTGMEGFYADDESMVFSCLIMEALMSDLNERGIRVTGTEFSSPLTTTLAWYIQMIKDRNAVTTDQSKEVH